MDLFETQALNLLNNKNTTVIMGFKRCLSDVCNSFKVNGMKKRL